MGEVVDRVPRIVDAWDPTKDVPLRPYVINSLSWYLFKAVRRHTRDQTRYVSIDTVRDTDDEPRSLSTIVRCHRSDREAAARYNIEEAEHAMSGLAQDDREVLVLSLIEGLSIGEIAEAMGVTRKRASVMRRQALEQCRRRRD